MATKYLHFIWLGSGRSRKFDIPAKGQLLDLAARAHLPVPDGAILLDDFFWLAHEAELVCTAGEKFIVPDAAALIDFLYDEIHFPRLDKALALRTAFPATVQPQLNIDPSDSTALAQALAALWTAVPPTQEPTRRDLLLMEMITAETGGTAVCRTDESKDTIIVDGITESLQLDRPGWLQRPDATLPGYGRRLQYLLRGLRRTFPNKHIHLTWADDGDTCWIMQLGLPEVA